MPKVTAEMAAKMAAKPGLFIVLEGIDGAGTTTQMHRVREWLEGQGHRAHSTCQPTDGPIGRYIRQILRGEEARPPHDAIALLFAADRLDHLEREIDPLTFDGCHVLCDRYLGSSLAYQGSHTDPAFVRMANSRARTPDLTVYVRVDPAVAMKRIGLRDGEKRELFEQRETLERISAAYDTVYGVAGPAELEGVVIDGERDMDTVFAEISEAVGRLLH